MNKVLLLLAVFIFSTRTFSQSNGKAVTKPTYDYALAKKLGADEYGMKKYVMAFLKSGKTKISDTTEAEKIQLAHLKNIMRLGDEGKLIVAGPFLDNESVRGIFIFNVESIDEGKRLTETDPAIKAGVLEMELRPWYGSAALVEAVKLHKKIEKKSVAE